MSRTNVFCLRLILPMLLFFVCVVAAQDSNPSKSTSAGEEHPAAQNDKPPAQAYHLDFSLNELEDGKKINSRQYSADLTTFETDDIRIGTRVPVQTKDGEFQYLDIGTNIFAQIRDSHGPSELLMVRAEISNFATPEHDPHDMHPVIRQIKMNGSTLLPLSKPLVIASADDPNSKRQFQLEVTATRLK
jgi:hypothetical protein